jgi:hypothetical protein
VEVDVVVEFEHVDDVVVLMTKWMLCGALQRDVATNAVIAWNLCVARFVAGRLPRAYSYHNSTRVMMCQECCPRSTASVWPCCTSKHTHTPHTHTPHTHTHHTHADTHRVRDSTSRPSLCVSRIQVRRPFHEPQPFRDDETSVRQGNIRQGNIRQGNIHQGNQGI